MKSIEDTLDEINEQILSCGEDIKEARKHFITPSPYDIGYRDALMNLKEWILQ